MCAGIGDFIIARFMNDQSGIRCQIHNKDKESVARGGRKNTMINDGKTLMSCGKICFILTSTAII